MSFIQKIRDKYARVAVIAIAVALIGFILTDYISGRGSSLFGADNSTLGKVNGKTIEYKEFARKLAIQEDNYKQQGQQVDQSQLVQGMWDQEVNQLVLQKEFENLGLTISDKELTDMLYGAEPHELARQYLGDPNSGAYDPNRAREIINSVKKGKNAGQKEQLNILLGAMEDSRLADKYKNLVAGSIHYPKWYLEKQNADNSLMAKVSYVLVPETVVPDSSKEIAVTDAEVADYISKHKDRYQLEDENRTIQYVKFSAAPSVADSAKLLQEVLTYRDKLQTTNDTAVLKTYLESESEYGYSDVYFPKSKIQVPVKDSIFKLAKNSVYGPYLDGGFYVMAKMIDEKTLPDSVFCRHILMRTSGEGGLPDSVANQRIDSVIAAINKGASFVSVMKQVSMDEAANSQDSTGMMRFTSEQIQDAKNFDQDFGKYILFDGTKGQRKKVKTKFGYHYIEIVDQKNLQPHYKIAYLAKKIETSDETERTAESEALQFAGSARDIKSFDTTFDRTLKQKQILKLFAYDIPSHAYYVDAIGVSRRFVKDIFEADKGEVMQPQKVGMDFVVAVVTEVNKKGTMEVAMAKRKFGVDRILQRQKKLVELKKKIGPITTLDAVAGKMNLQVQTADSVRLAASKEGRLSFERWLLGAIFNPANKGKVVTEPIQSSYNGVYVLRVDDVTATAVENADVAAQKKNRESQERFGILFSSQMSQYGQKQYNPADVLKKAASIKDNLNKFY